MSDDTAMSEREVMHLESSDLERMDLEVVDLDLDDDSDAMVHRVNGWLEAVLRSFHEKRADDEHRAKWVAALRADGSRLRGVYERGGLPFATDVPVATFSHLTKRLNTGSRQLPVRMITDVTVAPTHRRRGIMRRLMTANLADAAAQGLPLAVLTASEGSIYGRFGFGVATHEDAVRIDTTSRFRLRERPDDGERIVIVDPDASDAVRTAYERFHEVTRGSLERPAYYEGWLRGYDWEEQGEDRAHRVAIRLDAQGRPDGFVAWKFKDAGDHREVSVGDLVGATPPARIALWQFVADLDLADIAVARTANLDPLPWAVTDPRVITTTGRPDHVWVRILDVAAALSARPWFADDEVTIRVRDALGHADGTWTVTASGGTAVVRRSAATADVELDVEALGALYLGDVRVDDLAEAGRIVGRADGIRRFAQLTDGGPTPHCATHF
ncbi:putative acetyltransferase [Knoellia remsis]|uniref:Putative acetyltransferase n=1 Tax=Knoellia remsis TaxID=407159 RepID=A0A2T0UY86_9MICO|nr:GNAT family N-acetyltransferase [Knoellia remsis]PRY62893.1 putative acetyltransferase [Knoellia remsis]